jgi:hypothetical protein
MSELHEVPENKVPALNEGDRIATHLITLALHVWMHQMSS